LDPSAALTEVGIGETGEGEATAVMDIYIKPIKDPTLRASNERKQRLQKKKKRGQCVQEESMHNEKCASRLMRVMNGAENGE
jgi:hypothetical protein